MRLQARFWRLAFASGVSNLSDGLVSVVLPLVALQSTGSALAVAAVAAATRLPWLLFALPVGAVIDNVDRRALMVGAQIWRCGTGGSAVSGHGLVAVQLVVLALLLGTAEVLYDSASQTMLPSVVPKDSSAANSRLFGIEHGEHLHRPALGGLLVVPTRRPPRGRGRRLPRRGFSCVPSRPARGYGRKRPWNPSVRRFRDPGQAFRWRARWSGFARGSGTSWRTRCCDGCPSWSGRSVSPWERSVKILPVHVVEPGPMG